MTQTEEKMVGEHRALGLASSSSDSGGEEQPASELVRTAAAAADDEHDRDYSRPNLPSESEENDCWSKERMDSLKTEAAAAAFLCLEPSSVVSGAVSGAFQQQPTE